MFSALTDWGSFVSDKYKLLLYAPPKCASTSILTALVNLVDPEADDPNCLTSENLSSLDIHPYVRDHHAPTEQCISNAFANPDYCKILVLRDPLSRFLSAIASKYLIGFGPYAQELTLGSTLKHELKKNYSDIQNLKDDVNFVSKRLLTALSLGKNVTHVRPISDSFSEKDLSLFDHIFNVSNPEFSDMFLVSINHHLQQFGVSVDALPRFNESPLSIPADFLEPSILDSILQVYHDDYSLLGKDWPKLSDILSSDFDLRVFAQKNSHKLSSSVLFYDVSSKFFQKDSLSKELKKQKESLQVKNTDLLSEINSLTLEKEKALNWAQNLKEKIESERSNFEIKINELTLEKNQVLDRAQQLEMCLSNKNDEVQQLRLDLEKISYVKEVCILQILQLQEDLDKLVHERNTEVELSDSKVAKKTSHTISLNSKNKELSKIVNKQDLQIKYLVDLLLKGCQ